MIDGSAGRFQRPRGTAGGNRVSRFGRRRREGKAVRRRGQVHFFKVSGSVGSPYNEPPQMQIHGGIRIRSALRRLRRA